MLPLGFRDDLLLQHHLEILTDTYTEMYQMNLTMLQRKNKSSDRGMFEVMQGSEKEQLILLG